MAWQTSTAHRLSPPDDEFNARTVDFLTLNSAACCPAITSGQTDFDAIRRPGQNCCVHLHPTTRKFSLIPWDQEQPCGQCPRGSREQRENISIRRPMTGESQLLKRLHANATCRAALLKVLQTFNTA